MSQNELVSLESMPVAEAKVREAAAAIDFNDPTLTLSYGAKTMEDIAKFADSLLGNVRVKDSGPVGENLAELMLKVKDVNLEAISGEKKGFLESLPLVGRFFNAVERTVQQFDTVLAQVDGISEKLEDAKFGLLKDIEVLEQLYAHNRTFYENLSAHIQAGEECLARARAEELPRLEAEAQAQPGSLAAQNLRDYAERLNRFERRLHDLKLSRTITLQTAPQIRMLQSNDQTLAEKIQTSILATIPIWKNQMVLALSIHGQRAAARLQKDVADTTNSLLVKNAEMLQQSTVETAREVERSIVDLESLKAVHQKLLATIEETMNIAREGRERRRATEKELETMESDLRSQLLGMAGQKSKDALEGAHGEAAISAAEEERDAADPAARN
ncbi:MAG: toxic anion resistance protein [Desulfovibrio sp.]|nr:toxic anion resistance protein [Desulfovibrio sp.]MBO6170968.1 toxic anion resistance protein [Desulfovibrio sp.]